MMKINTDKIGEILDRITDPLIKAYVLILISDFVIGMMKEIEKDIDDQNLRRSCLRIK